MIVNLPRYENGVKFWDTDDKGYDIDLSMYCITVQSIDDFNDKVLPRFEPLTIETCEELKSQITKAIEKNTVIKFFTDERIRLDRQVKLILNDYPDDIKVNWENKLKPLRDELQSNNIMSSKFIFTNKDRVFEILDRVKQERIKVLKAKRKETNKTYYENKKKILNMDNAKHTLSDEEKKEKRKETNKKYYEKKMETIPTKVILTEDEIKAKRREANKNYYEKQKSQQLSKTLLSEEQKSENKKETNKKYYKSRKSLLDEINELKSMVSKLMN